MANIKKVKADLPLAQVEKPKDNSVRRNLIANITKDINKSKGEKVAFNLIEDKDAPTNVSDWISTTSIKLDYIIANRRPGGIPGGRIIEIFGEPSSGKSTLAQTICAQHQKNGGIAVYIDSENATSLENLALLGVNVEELIFVQEQCIEDTFQLIEQIITSVKNQMNDVPILIVWDSVAASVSRTELEATYEQQQIGIKARALSKGIMKVNQILKDKGVTLILLNQTRQKIGVIGSDPCVAPETKIKIRRQNTSLNFTLEQTITIGELFKQEGISTFNEVGMLNVEDSDIEIESYDFKTNTKCWRKVTDLVVKNESKVHYKLGTLKGTADHKVWYNGKWIELSKHPKAKLVKEPIEVLDLCVEDTHNYIAEGQINHNTTTPGGMAIPFAASVRLRVYTPSKIKELVDKQEVIKGIEIRVGAVKNKVARPYRQTTIQILYGKGVTDSELLFDDLRVFCESSTYKEKRAKYAYKDGIVANIHGSGGWKYIQLLDSNTGEIVKEQNFRKDEFESKILNNPEYKEYILALCDGCFILNAVEKDEVTKISGEVDENALT
jgi:RecA/RadA recombinase